MINVEHLSKRYGRHQAVDGASFHCAPGTITGFLGPNGAGKSTTLRVLTGLTRPDAGVAAIDGRPYTQLPNPGRLVGVLLDASAQHPGRTGAETLRLAARLLGMPASAAEGMLDRVGLGDVGGRRVGAYSLGMRQRLGIGTALLGDPAVLILDEPANGMDPEGIRWMRRLLRGFADGGGTVLLSSHLLAEVQATADRLVVIAHGRVVAEDSLDVLLAPSGTSVRGLDGPALANALRRAGLDVRVQPNGALLVDGPPEAVGRAALDAGQVLVELRPGDGAGVEDLFFELTA
jgi:ABC-2 type transport system ATP-binding protein